MNNPITWDPSLVKKFSSSNHYKLLNQLKTEVKKYPLNNRKKTSSIQNNEINLDIKKKSQMSHSQNISFSNNSNNCKEEENSNKSTVSFNNAKNFSIYNNTNISRQNESFLSDKSNSKEDSSSSPFKDRLNNDSKSL